ncbi:MAG: alpha/beta hydrolase fold domain-containing protein, partial [Bacteroidetes bacterium]|nr:alpha/beta hydrolase fold domain-containing protein [Bacteroidota bacterium]
SKADISLSYVTALLAKGISVMSVNYRLSPEVIVPNHYLDCARAIQYARHNVAVFNIDPDRIGASGSSAGGLTAFWLNFHNDLADPANADSVLRQTSRLKGVACWSGQTTVDIRVAPVWVAPIVLDFTSYFKGTIFGMPPESLKTPAGYALQELASPAQHVTADDPPVWMYYSYTAPPANSSEAIHHVGFGNGLKHLMDSLGLASSILTPAYTGSVTDSAVNFFRQRFGMTVAAAPEEGMAPTDFRLEQNYPNPFNPSTTIAFTVPPGEHQVALTIFDLLGREVVLLVNGKLSGGRYETLWDAQDHRSGIFFSRLFINGQSTVKKMLYLK